MAARSLQSGKSFGSLLDRPRFESSGPPTDTDLGDYAEQGGGILQSVGEELPPTPGEPHLNRRFEAQLPRQYSGKR
ncbi:MAG TPA: hypothetical protein VNI53_06010, partial [Gammaproteobacteria bacterium]|nr:hypothetical protein [Gammaproteobacteria bacterium]